MCGIFGWQYRPNLRPNLQKRTILATALARGNLTRGHDSYGWYDGSTGLIWRGMGSIVGNGERMGYSFSLLGHTRHATVGEKVIANAHPFEFGSVAGAHNGGVWNHVKLNEKRVEAGKEPLTCDSMHLIEALSNGLEAVKAVEGWGSVEWINYARPTEINLCKMKASADLAIAQTQQGIVWSSLESHLEEALKESGMDYILLKPMDEEVYNIRNGCIIGSGQKILLGEKQNPQMSIIDVSNGNSYMGHGGVYGSQYAGGHGRPFVHNESKKERKKREKEERETVAQLKLCGTCYEDLDWTGNCPKGCGKSQLAVIGAR